ncbi:MAG: WD40 repeat domain-containing serine/threonine protein kinase, partial [Limisphaerales bacterium]
MLGEIARGGMGVVYKARQIGVNRLVAIKTLQGGALASEDNLARLRREAVVLSGLRHPNIVTLHAMGESEGRPFLVMEYVEGQNLYESARNHPMAPTAAASLVAKVAEAVQHAHTQSILHRDLKPSNLLIDAQGEPHVSDFGIARLLGDDSDLTRTGQVVGSPSFMPPEQLTGGRNSLQPSADVYSLGAILYFTLTGRAPFVGPDLESVLIQCLGNDPPAPRLLNPGVPAALETLALKCLQREPLARFQRAGDLADELHRYLRGEPILSQPIGPLERAFRWCRRYPVVAGLGAALFVAMVSVITIVLIASFRLAEKARELTHAEYVVDMRRVQQAIEADHLAYAREILARYQPENARPGARKARSNDDLRGWEWFHFALKLDGNERFTLHGHSNGVTALAFAPGRPWLASGSTDGSLCLWDLSRTSLLTQTTIAGRIDALEYSASGEILFSGDNRGNIRSWRLPEMVESSPPYGWTSGIAAIRHLPEPGQLAVATRSSFDVFDVNRRQILESKPFTVWQRAAIRSDGKQ